MIFDTTPEVSWFVLGMLLLAIEMMTGTFVVLFFAVAALLLALIAWIGVVISPSTQVIVFALLSVGGLMIFKDRLRRAWSGTKESLAGDLHQEVVVPADVTDGAEFEVNYQGSKWIALNHSGRTLALGERVRIHKVDGVKLIVK